MSHTPGPWRISEAHNDVVDEMGRTIAEVVEWTDVAPANARLIAAAPMMLSALLLINEDKDGSGFVCEEAMDIIRGAIARAT